MGELVSDLEDYAGLNRDLNFCANRFEDIRRPVASAAERIRSKLPREVTSIGDLDNFYFGDIFFPDLSFSQRQIYFEGFSEERSWLHHLGKEGIFSHGFYLTDIDPAELYPPKVYTITGLHAADSMYLLPPNLHHTLKIETHKGPVLDMTREFMRLLGFEHESTDAFVWLGHADAERFILTEKRANMSNELSQGLFNLFFDPNDFDESKSRLIYRLNPELKKIINAVEKGEKFPDESGGRSYIRNFLDELSDLTGVSDGWLITLENKLSGENYGSMPRREHLNILMPVGLSRSYNDAIKPREGSHAAIFEIDVAEQINAFSKGTGVYPIHVSSRHPHYIVPLPLVKLAGVPISVDLQNEDVAKYIKQSGYANVKDVRELEKDAWLMGITPDQVTTIDPRDSICKMPYTVGGIRDIYKNLLLQGNLAPLSTAIFNRNNFHASTLMRHFGDDLLLPEEVSSLTDRYSVDFELYDRELPGVFK